MYLGGNEKFYRGEMLPKIRAEKPYVLGGSSALVYSGMSSAGSYFPILLTDTPGAFHARLPGMLDYAPVPTVDRQYRVKTLTETSSVLAPDPERALAENMAQDLKYCDEGAFLEALDTYVMKTRGDLTELREASTYFGVSPEKLNYWIGEAQSGNY